jgi:hypothetical protein
VNNFNFKYVILPFLKQASKPLTPEDMVYDVIRTGCTLPKDEIIMGIKNACIALAKGPLIMIESNPSTDDKYYYQSHER